MDNGLGTVVWHVLFDLSLLTSNVRKKGPWISELLRATELREQSES